MPVVDESKATFYFMGPGDSSSGAATVPWVTTSAILGIDVEACTFVYETPIKGESSCAYKKDVRKQLLVQPVKIPADSLVRMDPGARSASTASPSTGPTPSASESGGDTDPAPPSENAEPESSGASATKADEDESSGTAAG